MQDNKTNKKPYLALVLGVTFMGFAAIFIKSAHAPGLVTVFYRMAIASCVIVWPFFFSFKRQGFGINKQGFWFAVLSGIFFGIDLSLWSKGVVLINNATIPTLFANLAPVWVGFGAIFIFKEKPKFKFWIGVFISIAGMGMFILDQLYIKGDLWKGIVLGITAGVFYGAFYLTAQKGRDLLGTLDFLFISTASTALILFIFMLIARYPLFGYDTHSYIMFLGIGLGGQVIAWYLINYAQGHLPATIVAPTLLLQPVFTATWAVILLKEQLSLLQIIAGLIIIFGVYMVNKRK